MTAFTHQFATAVRLHLRNRMALIYAYLFPTMFLVAFWVLYRWESVPLVRHMGELLTVTILGGACFGLPTSLVSERERGIWRRSRLAPVPTSTLVAATLAARYLLLLTAGLLQIVLAVVVFGMPWPPDPIGLLVAFTAVSLAFMGLGLVIAMTADNVPAVQALGQCLFLPMLIIGGVAVRLESLPAWAQHVAAYFPGRYAVESIQATVTGTGLGEAGFALGALLVIGVAAGAAGARLFRWDAGQRFLASEGRGWLAAALAGWLAVGVTAQATGRVEPAAMRATVPAAAPVLPEAPPSPAEPAPALTPPTASAEVAESVAEETPDQPATGSPTEGPATENETPLEASDTAPAESDSVNPAAAVELVDAPSEASADESIETSDTLSWRSVTADDLATLDLSGLPPDEGVVSPVAALGEPVPAEQLAAVQCLRTNLEHWAPAGVADPVQRVRNVLYVAAVPDMFQMEEYERWVPRIVYEHLQKTTPWEDLTHILYWIATHPEDGDTAASRELGSVCIEIGGPGDLITLRERTRFYALKLLGRMLGVLEL